MLRLGPLPRMQLSCFVILICFSFKLTVRANGPYECSQGGHGAHDLIENGVMNPKYQWYKRGKKTYIPVVMDHSYSYNEHSTIIGGLQEISEKTCVEFDIYDNEAEVEEKDFVYINKNTKRGCYSYIGRIGGKQEIGLPVGCISHRTAMHEMLHALGFRHEHVRYDRDDYIYVYWENIVRGRESNFKKRSPSDLVSGPYDYASIMHYERKAFSKNGQETIRPLKPGATIGVRQVMSYWDAQKVNVVYKCGGSYSNSDLLEYSPELIHYNENHDRNESSLPIAEYDDFNREPPVRRDARAGGGHGDHNNHEDHDHHDDDNHHVFGPPPPPPPARNSFRHPPQRPQQQHDDRNDGPDENNENGVDESFADDHYDNNDPHNRIHYHNNQQQQQEEHQRPRENREHFHHRDPGDDFLTYLQSDSGDGRPTSSSTANNNNVNVNGNAEPFYDDFYDF